MSDYRQWIEAAVAHQRRAERAEHDLAAARAALERYEKALEFYADPFARRDERGEIIPVPDFYSEYDFGDKARLALAGATPETKP